MSLKDATRIGHIMFTVFISKKPYISYAIYNGYTDRFLTWNTNKFGCRFQLRLAYVTTVTITTHVEQSLDNNC